MSSPPEGGCCVGGCDGEAVVEVTFFEGGRTYRYCRHHSQPLYGPGHRWRCRVDGRPGGPWRVVEFA